MKMGTDKAAYWAKIRRVKWTNIEPPDDWDPAIRPISIEGLGLLGLDDKGNLYWDGLPVETRKRVKLTWPQTVAAVIVATCAALGGVGGAVQGWIAYNDWACRAGGAGWHLSCPPR